MPANQIQTKNLVTLTGKLCELEVTRGTKANPTEEAIRLSGSIMLNDDPNFKVSFRHLNHHLVRKLKKNGEPRKDYPKYLKFIEQAKPMSEAGADASMVTLTGHIVSNDFYNKNGELVEATAIEPSSIVVVANSAEQKDELIFQGMVRKQSRETRNSEETGRIRAEVLGIDFMGVAIPFEFIVPEKYANAFEDRYEPHTCARFSLKHELRIDVTQQPTGGIGEQWTEGKPRVEWVLCGATDPIDEDDDRAIPATVIKEGLAKRAENLERLKERQNANTDSQPTFHSATTNAGSRDINVYGDDPDELPF